MNKGLKALNEIKEQPVGYDSDVGTEYLPECKIIEKELKALEIISQNFKLVGNCLHAKNKYAEDGWVFVKEIEDEEELDAWKEVLL